MSELKKGRGRPKLPENEKYNQGFKMNLTPEMADRLRTAVTANGQTLAEALRMAAEFYVTSTETRLRQ